MNYNTRNAMRATSNWTGRTPRTSQEAFGSQLHFAQERPAVARWLAAAYVACVFALAAVALILKGEE